MVAVIEQLFALPLWQPDVLWWPIATGLVYLLLWIAGSHLARAVRRWQARQTSPGVIRLGRWHGWALLERAVGICFGVAWLFVLLTGGVYTPDDVGVSPVAWEQALPWAAAITLGGAAWLGLLWIIYGQRKRPDTSVRASIVFHPVELLLDSAQQETVSAILRASLIPWLGSYWGVWGAMIVKPLAARLNPRLRVRMRVAGQRELVYLDWALDWVGAALFLFGKSVWIALAGRALCGLLVLGALEISSRLQRQRASGSGEDHRQPDQRSEHGGSEDPDALQVA